MIIEEATGLYFPVAMENYLGDIEVLDHTYFMWSDTISGDFAHPWFDLDGNGTLDDAFDKFRTAVASVSFGTGGVISTAEDMARWMKYLFEGNVLTQESMDQMLEFSSPYSGGWYGMGAMKYSIFSTEFWGHTGWSPGYNAIVYYSPVDSLSIAALSNDNNAYNHEIFKALLEVIYATDHPRLFFDNSMLDLGELSTSVSKYDTTFFVYNTGGEKDSVLAYLTYTGSIDSNALSLTPPVFELAPSDSQAITLTINPDLLTPERYTIKIFLDSKFSLITPRVVKIIKLNITGPSFNNVIQDIPANFVLNQNFPNPFNPSTTIQYFLPRSKEVVLKIYNLQGQEIETLINEKQNAGSYEIFWYPMNIPNGIYIFRLEAGDFVDSKKLMLVK
jgi:hypothetical protein